MLDDSAARTLQPELASPFDVVPRPFVEHDRPGMQERKHFMGTNSTPTKKNFVRRGVHDLERSPLLDVKGEAMDVSTARTLHPEISSPFESMSPFAMLCKISDKEVNSF